MIPMASADHYSQRPLACRTSAALGERPLDVIVGHQRFPAAVIELDAVTGSQ
jgi:hypothetical protein